MTGATIFSGFGGADIGMKAAGLEMRWGIELEDDIAAIARMNGLNVRTADVCELHPNAGADVDALHLSPPCPSFSIAKANREEQVQDRRVALASVRFIEAIRPKIVTLENVWGYRQSESWRTIYRALMRLGYGVGHAKVNMADYGVPQTRERMIVWALRSGKVAPPPTPSHAKDPPPPGLFGDVLPRWIGWFEAIVDLVDTLPESELADWQKRRLPDDLKTLLVGAGGFRNEIVNADEDDPSFTVTANRNQSNQLRAVLIDGQGTAPAKSGNREDRELLQVDGEDPSYAVKASQHKGIGRAVLMQNGNEYSPAAEADRPSPTVVGATGGISRPRAVLVGQNANATSGVAIERGADEPSSTIRTGRNHVPKAVLVDGDNGGKMGPCHNEEDRPSKTVTSASGAGRAIVIGEGANSRGDAREMDEPMKTVPAKPAGGIPRAVMLSGQSVEGQGAAQREGDQPAVTVMTNAQRGRGIVGARVVQLTPRCLARFQTFPDTYQLPESRELACKGIGNAVPPLFMQRLYEHLINHMENER